MRNSVWKPSWLLEPDKEKWNVERRERADADLDINFLICCCSSHTCLFTASVFKALSIGSNCHFYIFKFPTHTSLFQATSTPLTVFQFEFLPANQNSLLIYCWYICIFNSEIRCYLNLDFPPFNSPLQPFSLSLSLLALILFLMFLYHCPVVDN